MSAAREVLVVGSGASAVHFALEAIERGHRVTMLDVGHRPPGLPRPEDTFRELVRNLDDPVHHFLGEDFSSVVLPDSGEEYYGFPPGKEYVFRTVEGQRVEARGFAPLVSFARGGLAEAWTAGVYPFADAELEAFPFGYRDLEPYYERVAERIGVSGAEDDLARFLPVHANLLPPPDLDAHARRLVRRYEERRAELNGGLGCYLGRSRLATLSRDHGGRTACTSCGRCLWGCPSGSLYTPSITLRRLESLPDFTYIDGRRVTHFEFDDGGRIGTLVAERVAGGGEERFPVETLVLAAGTLSSARIYLASLARGAGSAPALGGLMDNRQIMLPFVNLGMIGRPFDPNTYQYHQLNLGLAAGRGAEYVHAQITTLGTALIHPIVQSLPLDLRTALHLFRHVHAALGLVNVNLHDTPRPENRVELETDGGERVLSVRYAPAADEPARLERVLRTYRRALRKLGCLVPPGMTHVRPMGSSVHYAGTLPMSAEARPHTVSAEGRSREFPNLLIVDGSVLPFLPAKNLTFTLMANAARIADVAL